MVTHSSIFAWKNPMDRGAWQAAVQGVTKSRTQLSSWAHMQKCIYMATSETAGASGPRNKRRRIWQIAISICFICLDFSPGKSNSLHNSSFLWTFLLLSGPIYCCIDCGKLGRFLSLLTYFLSTSTKLQGRISAKYFLVSQLLEQCPAHYFKTSTVLNDDNDDSVLRSY